VQSGTNPHLPFGGVNGSGIGRVGGHQGFLEFSNARSVVEETKAADGLTPLPPLDDKTRKMMAGMLGRSTVVPAPIIMAIETVLKIRAAFK
jgi:aldehyde dehydrogenase (NAD+)